MFHNKHIYTCIFNNFCYLNRNMLSAAHVLAMDAKNLLDVVDSIRIKYPKISTSSDVFESTCSDLRDEDNMSNAKTSDITSELMDVSGKIATINLNDDNIEQTYQNCAKNCEGQPTSNQEEIYANQNSVTAQIKPINRHLTCSSLKPPPASKSGKC